MQGTPQQQFQAALQQMRNILHTEVNRLSSCGNLDYQTADLLRRQWDQHGANFVGTQTRGQIPLDRDWLGLVQSFIQGTINQVRNSQAGMAYQPGPVGMGNSAFNNPQQDERRQTHDVCQKAADAGGINKQPIGSGDRTIDADKVAAKKNDAGTLKPTFSRPVSTALDELTTGCADDTIKCNQVSSCDNTTHYSVTATLSGNGYRNWTDVLGAIRQFVPRHGREIITATYQKLEYMEVPYSITDKVLKKIVNNDETDVKYLQHALSCINKLNRRNGELLEQFIMNIFNSPGLTFKTLSDAIDFIKCEGEYSSNRINKDMGNLIVERISDLSLTLKQSIRLLAPTTYENLSLIYKYFITVTQGLTKEEQDLVQECVDNKDTFDVHKEKLLKMLNKMTVIIRPSKVLISNMGWTRDILDAAGGAREIRLNPSVESDMEYYLREFMADGANYELVDIANDMIFAYKVILSDEYIVVAPQMLNL